MGHFLLIGRGYWLNARCSIITKDIIPLERRFADSADDSRLLNAQSHAAETVA